MFKVILANGDGQRFRDAGYTTPKHLLPFGDTTVIGTIAGKLPTGGALRVITRNQHLMKTSLELEGLASGIGLSERRGVVGDLLQLTAIPDNQELLVNYCDCWLDDYEPFLRRVRTMKFDAGVIVFSSREERHTQLLPGVAFGGIYWFKSGALFKEKARQVAPDSCVLAVVHLCEYTIHMSYAYTDVGIPEDYEKCRP